ncbi:MAG: glycosidase, partial [Desulfocucumaceae bacterium]
FKYWFVTGVCSDDLLDELTFAFNGRVSSFIENIQSVEKQLEGIKNVDIGFIVSSKVSLAKEEQRKDFLRFRDHFLQLWEQKDLETKPPLIPAHYLEFIPGIPTVLPKKIEGRKGKVISSEEMFHRLQSRYQEAFSSFLRDGLGTSENADSKTIIGCMKEFMSELEKTMEWLLPGDLYTEEGMVQVIDGIFR